MKRIQVQLHKDRVRNTLCPLPSGAPAVRSAYQRKTTAPSRVRALQGWTSCYAAVQEESLLWVKVAFRPPLYVERGYPRVL